MAAQIEKIHGEEAALHYNNEQSLRSVIKRAYFSYGDEFVLFEELPAGIGYTGDILLVGINYDKEAAERKHTCVIEKYQV